MANSSQECIVIMEPTFMFPNDVFVYKETKGGSKLLN